MCVGLGVALDDESATMSQVKQKGCGHIACFDVLLAEMFSHVDVTHCGLVCGVKAHGYVALIVAIDDCGVGVAEAQVEEHAWA